MSNSDITYQENKLLNSLKSKSSRIVSILIASTFSGTVLAYVLSKFFINTYLREINFDSLIYDAFIDTTTISPFFFSILMVVLATILTFLALPAFLRYLYHDSTNTTSNIDGSRKKIIDGLFTYSLTLPSIVILACLFLKVFIVEHFLLYIVLPALAYILIFYSEIKSITIELAFKLVLNFILFSTSLSLSMYPLLLLYKAIVNSAISDLDYVVLVILFVLWISFTIVTGFRITRIKPIQYAIDLTIALLIFVEILILSPKSIISNISTYVGIADQESRVYKINNRDFKDIKDNIEILWYADDTKTCSQITDNEKIDFKQIEKACYFEFSENESKYINSKIIYRSGDKVVLCPPNYIFGKDMNYKCFIADDNKLEPTSFDIEFMLEHKKFSKKIISRSLSD